MQQLVTDITRPSPNNQSNGSCLDLVITNDTFAISDLAITSNFSTSDHHSASFKITTYIPSYNNPSSRYDLPNADLSALNNHLYNTDWSSAFSNCQDVASQFDLWNEKLTEALHLFVPIKSNCNIHENYSRKYPVHIRKLLSKKRCAWGIYKNRHGAEKLKKILHIITVKHYIYFNVIVNGTWWTQVILVLV